MYDKTLTIPGCW